MKRTTFLLSTISAIFMCLLAQISFADTKIDVIAIDSGSSLKHLMRYYEDVDNTKSIADIAFIEWQASDQGLSFGYTKSAYWFEATFENTTEEPITRLFSIGYPVLDRIELYQKSDNGLWEMSVLGDKQEFTKRFILHRNFIIPLTLKPAESQRWVFRVDTSSAMQFPATLWQERDFFIHDQSQILGLGLYFGIMLIMILYNLFVFFSTREMNYLAYVLYTFCMMMFLGSLQGINFHYLWPKAIHWNDQSIVVFLAGVVIFAGIFTRNFLRLYEYAPKLNIFLSSAIVVVIAIAMMSNILEYQLLIELLIVIACPLMIMALTIGIKRWYEGYQPARYYTIAWSTFLLGGVILALNKFNIIPRNLFTEHALQIGSAMEVMLLSFALADRLNTEKRDRFEAQQEALKLEKTASKAQKEALDQERNARIAQEKALEHERQAREAQARALEIQHRATETLEEKVRERTAELQVANARLEQMSSTDALTNVPNRRHFEEVLSHEFALAVHDQMPLGVMMIDIDFFKAVNDQFGHQTGDEILRCIAETINDQVSDHDLVARYGGEEFVVVAPLKEANKTLALAERIRKSIAEYDFSRIIDGLNMTVSIGVHAGIPKKTEHQDQWVAMADTALYNSKEQGRNKVTLANQVK